MTVTLDIMKSEEVTITVTEDGVVEAVNMDF